MEKTLKLDESTARKLYPTASPEFKELLEQNFTKEFFSQKITDKVNDYNDIMKLSGTEKSDDMVTIKGFTTEDNLVVTAFIKKMRVAKIYNEGWLPKRGEKRWYSWFNVSFGFEFLCTYFDTENAGTASAARLCFKDEALARSAAKKFIDIEKDFIDLQ